MWSGRLFLLAAGALCGLASGAVADPAVERTPPIMTGLDKIGLAKPLKDANFNIFGHVEGSYTYNFNPPPGDLNSGRVFDVDHNEVILNQLDLTIERTIADPKKFDLGGRMEWIYGGDARFIHSNGLFDHHLDDASPPDNQWDLNQLYLDVSLPLGNGVRLRVGKFVTLLGQETINPLGNALYSHSYLFGYAIPFTHTGIMATYTVSPNWTFEGGVFRGWEQWEDNNDAVSFHLKGAYTSDDGKLGITLNLVTGPEQTDDEDDYRTVIDLIVSYKLAPDLSLAANADYGFENGVPGLGDAQWYGVAVYATYTLSASVDLNGRAEWFRDDDGSRIGIAADFFEVTLGATIKPFSSDPLGQNLRLRPELRWDHASRDFFDGGARQNQLTAALDVIIQL
jgi:hypothetical protein